MRKTVLKIDLIINENFTMSGEVKIQGEKIHIIAALRAVAGRDRIFREAIKAAADENFNKNDENTTQNN